MNGVKEIESYKRTEQEHLIAALMQRAHPVVTFGDDMQLAGIISAFVDRGLNHGAINLFFATSGQLERYISYLKEAGLDADKLVLDEELILEPIDALLLEPQVDVIVAFIKKKLDEVALLAEKKGRRGGLNVIGEIAGNLAKQQSYDEAILIETFWSTIIPSFKMPITLICLYSLIPTALVEPLRELHSSVLPIQNIWEITPANFKCINCGITVEREIRVHEPQIIKNQSEVVTIAMRENKAGWIPYCFDCISNHPFLKPSWLRT